MIEATIDEKQIYFEIGSILFSIRWADRMRYRMVANVLVASYFLSYLNLSLDLRLEWDLEVLVDCVLFYRDIFCKVLIQGDYWSLWRDLQWLWLEYFKFPIFYYCSYSIRYSLVVHRRFAIKYLSLKSIFMQKEYSN